MQRRVAYDGSGREKRPACVFQVQHSKQATPSALRLPCHKREACCQLHPGLRAALQATAQCSEDAALQAAAQLKHSILQAAAALHLAAVRSTR